MFCLFLFLFLFFFFSFFSKVQTVYKVLKCSFPKLRAEFVVLSFEFFVFVCFLFLLNSLKKLTEKQKAKYKKRKKLRPARPHTSPRPHTPHTPKTRPTPRCANTRAHGHANIHAHTHPILHVKEFKSKQFTFENGPKPKKQQVVPTGMLDFLSFEALLGRFQK